MVHKMKTLEEVLYDYTRGEKTLEEANKALKELGCGLTLDPTRNLFSARELLETRAGETPDEANGWGILDHGVGSLEKVHVVAARWTWTWARRPPMSIWPESDTACGAMC